MTKLSVMRAAARWQSWREGWAHEWALDARQWEWVSALRGAPPLSSSVRLVRVSPRRLDDDNLSAALKSVRDGVADVLGVDDGDSRVVYVVDQESGRAGVLVEVYP